MESTLFVLENPVQNYAWGSRTAIAGFLGRPGPSARPEAELWIGAHPKAPSRVIEPAGHGSLEDLIASDPISLLGREVCDRFGNELPFLLKVLAAAAPLSIQAHPNREQARRGWARENAEGLPVDAPQRNYRDTNHKPELVCALVPFVALKGFRAHEEIARLLGPVAQPELTPELARLGRERSAPALRALLARLLTLEPEQRAAILRRTASHAERSAPVVEWAWVTRLLQVYPDDAGVLAPLYLNLLTLAPGEALFLPAGELHAYLEGTALELMANSDNVLRGGLTPKHVDVQELLATLVFEPRPPEVLRAEPSGPGERIFRTPALEFELGLVDVAADRPGRSGLGQGVEVLLGLEGEVLIQAGGLSRTLRRGLAIFVPASLAGYDLRGTGRIARARVPGQETSTSSLFRA